MALKVLFVSSYDLRRNTSSNIRTVALIKALTETGARVDCFFIKSADSNVDNKISSTLNTSTNKIFTYPKTQESVSVSGVVVKQNKIKELIRNNIISLYNRLTVYDIYEILFAKLKKQDVSELDNDYDVIISSSEPRSSHKLAKKLIKYLGFKGAWIQYWGDPMTNDVASKKFLSFREKMAERKLINLSDASIYTNPCTMQYMQNKYKKLAHKIMWIPTSDISNVDDGYSSTTGNGICYLGDYLSKYRNIKPLYEACLECGIQLSIIGNGDIDLATTENITVKQRVPREEAKQIESESKILVVLENVPKSKGEPCIQVPGKLYHYSLTNKYVLVISESDDIAENYKQYNRFIFVKNEKDEIIRAINGINNGEYDFIKNAPVESFKRHSVASSVLEIIKEICEK